MHVTKWRFFEYLFYKISFLAWDFLADFFLRIYQIRSVLRIIPRASKKYFFFCFVLERQGMDQKQNDYVYPNSFIIIIPKKRCGWHRPHNHPIIHTQQHPLLSVINRLNIPNKGQQCLVGFGSDVRYKVVVFIVLAL